MSGSPSYSYRPDFVASATDCIMPKTNETRSRLWAGGTFFRSISAGSAMNFIELTISNPTGNVFVLTVNRLDPITNNILEQEIYTVTEAVILGAPAIPPDPNIPNDPGTPAGTDKSSAIPALRSLVNTNSVLIKMKERAIDADGIPVIPPPDIYDTGGDASSISAFSSVLMSGASGAPIPPPSPYERVQSALCFMLKVVNITHRCIPEIHHLTTKMDTYRQYIKRLSGMVIYILGFITNHLFESIGPSIF